jgi:predicted component of type VI protein secretion system
MAMQVKLKVSTGSRAGTEIPVGAAKFLIGRGEDCQLRPQSDMVSRHHCMLSIGNSQLTVSDMGSRNGTYVNGEKIADVTQLKIGDKLRVGPLEFEIMVDHAVAGVKRPKVVGVADAASRTQAPSVPGQKDEDVTAWLEEADQAARIARHSQAETRQFNLSDVYTTEATTDSVAINADQTQEIEMDDDGSKGGPAKGKKSYGKLPQEKIDAKDSRAGAEEALKRFFNRR